ncbi:MAG: hypothetical protein D6715_07475 [Calditrichaeota bacterium]|nr:MAG: hypothetical protein D6715_07475 [Calditrichota bacterium]
MAEYLIDGYNLLYATGLPRAGAAPLEDLRERLCVQLQQFARAGHHRVTVVFDGQGKGIQLNRSYRNVKVLFSPTHREADEVIQHQIRRCGDPRQLVVVSSDQDILHTARAHGATIVRSEAFARTLFAGQASPLKDLPEQEEKHKDDPTLSPEELQYWLRQFQNPPNQEDEAE